MGDLPSLSFFDSPDCVASFSRPPSRSTSALPDAMAAMASSFNSSFCAAANGARVIPASTVTTTNLMVYLPTLSIRRGEAGRRIFLRQQRQHGKGRGGIGHKPGWYGARFVQLVHGGGLPAAAFGVLMRAQPGEGCWRVGNGRNLGSCSYRIRRGGVHAAVSACFAARGRALGLLLGCAILPEAAERGFSGVEHRV